tara:strand:- start:3217 stop:4212 length:996 start_codon:yes stop_codon:yes gene_type:complete
LKKTIYIWCNDISKSSGEGILANKFIDDLKKYNKNYNCIIKIPNSKSFALLRTILGSIIDRFLLPFLGVLYLWSIFLTKKNKKLCFVNFLPLWNFTTFALIPPNTIIGPITGGSKFLKKPLLNYIIREYIFNIFYKISISILKIRRRKILFSTSLLKKIIPKKNKNYYFDYVLKDFKFKKSKNKKKFDLIFYLRCHKNKNTILQNKLANSLSSEFKIITIGNKINNKSILNLGNISRSGVRTILKKTKFAFLSSENLLSFFSLDCLENGTYIFYNNQERPNRKTLKNSIPLNYSNYEKLYKIIRNKLKNKYKKPSVIDLKTNNKFCNYFRI